MCHQFRFGYDHSASQNLITLDGNISGLAQLPSLLPENVGFALAALLQTNCIDKLLTAPDDSSEFTREFPVQRPTWRLMAVFASLFFVVPLRASSRAQQWLNSPSRVVLPELPPSVTSVLSAYRKSTLLSFESYYHQFVQTQNNKDWDVLASRLPVSGNPFIGNANLLNESPVLTGLAGSLKPSQVQPVKSPFVACSGVSEAISSIIDVTSFRDGIWMQPSLVPTITHEDSRGIKLPLNAYAVDFLRHGRFYVLQKDNHLPTGQIYQLLNLWLLLITIIQTFLSSMDNDLWALHGDRAFLKDTVKRLNGEFKERMHDLKLQSAISASMD